MADPNLHRAIEWGADNARPALAAEISAVLWHHYVVVLYGRPTADWFEPLLPHFGDLDPKLQMAVLHGSGVIAYWHGQPEQAKQHLMAEHDIFQRTGLIPPTGATAYSPLAAMAAHANERDESVYWYRTGLDAVGDIQGLHLSNNLARVLFDAYGDAQQALDVLEEASGLSATVEETAITTFGPKCFGDSLTSTKLIHDTLPLLRQQHIRADLLLIALEWLGHVERDGGNPDLAASLYLEAIDVQTSNNLAFALWDGWESIYLAHLLIAPSPPTKLATRRITGRKPKPQRGRVAKLAQTHRPLPPLHGLHHIPREPPLTPCTGSPLHTHNGAATLGEAESSPARLPAPVTFDRSRTSRPLIAALLPPCAVGLIGVKPAASHLPHPQRRSRPGSAVIRVLRCRCVNVFDC